MDLPVACGDTVLLEGDPQRYHVAGIILRRATSWESPDEPRVLLSHTNARGTVTRFTHPPDDLQRIEEKEVPDGTDQDR